MKVDVLDAETGQRVFTCSGPNAGGDCQCAPSADPVACAGHVIRTHAGPGQLDTFGFLVSRTSPVCPIRSLNPSLL